MEKTMNKLILILAAGLLAGCATAPEKTVSQEESKPAASTASTDSGLGSLKITDKEVGSGTEAVAGKNVSVHYTGRLLTGKQFDSSVGRGPFRFRLGAGQVISGWDQGVAGMKVGGKRELVIPPHMGYGAAGAGGVIPPNATLVFDVELLGVE
jgi:FKBP-type peptidyl-prolyl cis-trans isomerase